MKRSVALAAAIPAFVLGAVEIGMLVIALFSDHPLWRSEPLNLSEAAALRDTAEIARLVERGEDPNIGRMVRAGFLDGDAHTVTPLEAATFNRLPGVMHLLTMYGAKLDKSAWRRLRCFAQHKEGDDVTAELDVWRPAGVLLQCSGTERAWATDP